MNTGERRGEILKILKQAEVPIAARELAGRFGVQPPGDRAGSGGDPVHPHRESSPQQKAMSWSRTAAVPVNSKYVTVRTRQPQELNSDSWIAADT